MLVVAGLAALVWPAVMLAQDTPRPQTVQADLPPEVLADRAAYILVYDHVTGMVELRNNKQSVLDSWDSRLARTSAPLAGIPPDRPLAVVIENANSLLYEYSVSIDAVGTKKLRSCTKLGGQFATTAFLVGVGMLQGTAVAPAAPEYDFDFGERFVLRDTAQFTRRALEGGTLGEATLERAVDRVAAAVDEFNSFASNVSSLSLSLPDSLRRIALLAEAMPIDSLLDNLQQSINGVAPGLSDPNMVTGIVDEKFSVARSSLEDLRLLNAQIDNGRYQGELSDNAVIAARVMNDRTNAVLSDLNTTSIVALQESLVMIEMAKMRSIQGFTASSSGGTFRRVTIGVTNLSLEGLEGVRGFRAGDVVAFTEPAVKVVCQFSFGFALMDPPPDYATETVNDSVTILVDKTKEDDLRPAANVLFHVSPASIPLGVLFGLGFGSEKYPDLYLGGMFRIFDPVMLNAGVVWQRQKVLDGGLAVGQPVPGDFTPETLDDLSTRYFSYFWAGVSISP
jgi:hypothetical protein